MSKKGYTVYIIEKSGEWVPYSIEASFIDACNTSKYLQKYEGAVTVILENE